ncbi:glycosyltransferase family 1 protein [Tetraselmis virus 1]|uniref:Glycosyltransferase family 1 protein n=1 Tax=Tetraselmis virus 1 TaxID=2060617 RepID=A0A2P0VNG4_9VIRU|nr:glycosyltransferase family 1 protein [Tetraselmis virus 1]AUF82410.1 glycosyltransferase family 1 protein [Tetraselmis virus 1]
MSSVFIVSHNNASEGAPHLCKKLECMLKKSGIYKYVCCYTSSLGVNPIDIPVIEMNKILSNVGSAALSGLQPVLILSTVVMCQHAARIRNLFRSKNIPDSSYRILGLVHEVRNETFQWVKPFHFNGIDHLVFVAEYTMKSYGAEYGPSIPKTVIRNWLTVADKNKINSIRSIRKPIVLLVGVVAQHKGQLHVVKAFNKISRDFPMHEIHLIGHVYDEKYAREISEACVGVKILGSCSHEKVIESLRTCEVFVHGSPMESCCLSIMEAMYCECPIVASRVGGIPEQILDGHDGILYEYNNVDDCANALKGLLLNKDLQREIGSNARRSVLEKFYEKDKLTEYKNTIKNTWNLKS